MSRVDPDHEGHWGWTSGQLLSQCDTWFATARPEVVVVHVGTNDAVHNTDPDGVGGRVMSMISLLHARFEEAVVVVAKIVRSLSPTVQSRVERVNRSIEAALPRDDERVRIVDCSTLLVAQQYADSLHPNDSGYVVLGTTLADAVIAISPRGRASLVLGNRSQLPVETDRSCSRSWLPRAPAFMLDLDCPPPCIAWGWVVSIGAAQAVTSP